MAKLVQVMLLRFGIIAARKPRFGQWRVEIYGANAHKFRDAIGFVSGYKNGLLRCPTGDEEGYLVPVNSDALPPSKSLEYGSNAFWVRQNARGSGYVTRRGARLLGISGLEFHHDKIVRIERFRGPAMCVEVPLVGRFLQDGFDGCNSKGLEWPVVWVVGCNEMVMPHPRGDEEEERRLMYVAATRARDLLVLSHVRELATRVGLKTVERSHFLDPVFPGPETPAIALEAVRALVGVYAAEWVFLGEVPVPGKSRMLHEVEIVEAVDAAIETVDPAQSGGSRNPGSTFAWAGPDAVCAACGLSFSHCTC
jgi:hypothetical protein